MASTPSHPHRRRPEGARAGLSVVAGLAEAVAPLRLAAGVRLAVPGAIGAALPAGGVQRGSALTVGGRVGAGATSAALQVAAAATGAGEWAAVLDPGSLGGLAALEAGVLLERCAVVRGVDDRQWPVVVGALLDGVTVVVAPVPERLALGDARRLLARVRERQGVLVLLESVPGVARIGRWPAEAALRLSVSASSWASPGVDARGEPTLGSRSWSVRVEGKGMVRTVPVSVARAG